MELSTRIQITARSPQFRHCPLAEAEAEADFVIRFHQLPLRRRFLGSPPRLRQRQGFEKPGLSGTGSISMMPLTLPLRLFFARPSKEQALSLKPLGDKVWDIVFAAFTLIKFAHKF
ncbi:hypothetical protein Dimus_038013 [Dionaea muscipula]